MVRKGAFIEVAPAPERSRPNELTSRRGRENRRGLGELSLAGGMEDKDANDNEADANNPGA
jgi:hypothetical protein